MNVLITNAVPLNGGDEALLRGLIESIARRVPSARFSVLCRNLALCRRYLPDLDLAPDLEFAEAERYPRDDVLVRYARADVVLSAPGGFFHDHYPIENRLVGLELAMGLGKPVMIIGQSLGPFWKPESIERVRGVFNRLTAIAARDQRSVDQLTAIGVNPDLIHLTADVAFLWRHLAPELHQPRRSADLRTIGLCVRMWPLKDQDSARRTIAKAASLARTLLEADADRRVVMISTCQGVEGYWDDSQLSLEVRAALPAELAQRCVVDRDRRRPRELIAALGGLDAFIGMRLHGCLLAMLAGTPAFGLAYEPKTPEIYEQLGLADHQIDFEQPAEAWIAGASRFLRSAASLRDQLPAALDRLAHRATLNIDLVERCLPAWASPRQPGLEAAVPTR